MAHRLFLVKLKEDLVEEVLAPLVNHGLVRFAGNLEVARECWRAYPDLVEAPEFPDHLRKIMIESGDWEPGEIDRSNIGTPDLELIRKEELPLAITIAKERLARQRLARERPHRRAQKQRKRQA